MKKILSAIIVVGILLLSFIFFNTKQKRLDLQKNILNNISEEKKTISEDVCGTFSKEFISGVLNKNINKIEDNHTQTTNTCRYYTDENSFVTLRLNNLSVENQKKGQTALGRTITNSDKIKTEHFIVMQDDGLINEVILVINPNLFIAVDRSSTKAASEIEIVELASKIAASVQDGEAIPKPTTEPTQSKEVPLPQEQDIIRSFFEIINEHRPSDAVSMMIPDVTNDDSVKQAWAVQFNAFKSISVKSIEPSNQTSWSEQKHVYKVNANVEMKPEAANAMPIPNYGWENGNNTKWITIQKIGNLWKVAEIASGP